MNNYDNIYKNTSYWILFPILYSFSLGKIQFYPLLINNFLASYTWWTYKIPILGFWDRISVIFTLYYYYQDTTQAFIFIIILTMYMYSLKHQKDKIVCLYNKRLYYHMGMRYFSFIYMLYTFTYTTQLLILLLILTPVYIIHIDILLRSNYNSFHNNIY